MPKRVIVAENLRAEMHPRRAAQLKIILSMLGRRNYFDRNFTQSEEHIKIHNRSGVSMKIQINGKLASAGYDNGKTHALQDTMGWLSGLLLIGGSVLMALLPGIGVSPAPYFAFLVANVCLSFRFLMLRDTGQIALNVAMSLLDIYAIALRV